MGNGKLLTSRLGGREHISLSHPPLFFRSLVFLAACSYLSVVEKRDARDYEIQSQSETVEVLRFHFLLDPNQD